tara:strand:+ start:1300 stop:2163 length:864 start_codon:yes stop_codon:yes gene_type:complete
VKDHLRSTYRFSTPLSGLTQRFTFLGLVFFAFALLLLAKVDKAMMERVRVQVTDSVAPIIDAMSRPLALLNDAIVHLNALAQVHERNEKLQQDKDRLLQWQSVARMLQAENQALRAQLNYVPGPDASYISARVIADTGGAFAHSVLLNIGHQPGVEKGHAVVTGDGLIGRVEGVGSRATRVLLISDLNSRIPVLIEATRARAILAGNNSNRPRLIHLSPGVTVSPGDRIVTSGHGGVFPVGLPIGLVDAVNEEGISVLPFVPRDRLEYVRILDFGLEGIINDDGLDK